MNPEISISIYNSTVTAVFSVCIVWKFTYWLQICHRDLAVSMIME